jgi:hypothetical protein
MSYLQSAFEAVCQEAKKPETWYVSLMENVSSYGGPEEGGWWTHDHVVVAYQAFPTEEQALAAKEKVEQLAEELQADSRRDYGEQCLRETEWLEARGLDDSFFPESDGPSEFYVGVSQGFPQESYGPTHYE